MDDFCINAIGEISVGERGDTLKCLDLDGSELTTLFCQVWLHRFFHQVG